MANTGFKYPTATGEDYNQWTNPSDAFSSNDTNTIASTVNFKQDYYNFGFTFPSVGTVDGIEIAFEAKPPVLSAGTVGVELSWDSGPSYTATAKTFTTPDASAETTYTVGGAADTWGRTWTFAQLANANFRLRINADTTDGVNSTNIDGIQVKVYYTATITKTFTADGLLHKTFAKTFSADGNKRKVTTRTFTTDSYIGYTRFFHTDALLRKKFTKTFTTDSTMTHRIPGAKPRLTVITEKPKIR